MTISKTSENGKLKIGIDGRLDTLTAPELEKELKNSLDGVNELEFDFTALDYISSAGLRVLLWAQKKMSGLGGEMYITGASEDVREIFTITGFSEILTIK